MRRALQIKSILAPKRAYDARRSSSLGTPTAPQDAVSTSPGSPQPASSSPPPRRPLPLSPLMIPIQSASSPERKISFRRIVPPSKLPPTRSPTEFQSSLAKNPFALALATPVRMCALTRTVLPSFFLMGFRLVERDETGEVWYLPRDLVGDGPVEMHDGNGAEGEEGELIGMTEDRLIETEEIKLMDQETETEITTEAQSRSEPDHVPDSDTHAQTTRVESLHPKAVAGRNLGPRVYVLSRFHAILASSDINCGYGKDRWRRFIGPRMREKKSGREMLDKARWRIDMHDWAPELMRRRVVRELVMLGRMKRGYITGCSEWDEVRLKHSIGGVLWVGGEQAEGEVDEGRSEWREEEMVGNEQKTIKSPCHAPAEAGIEPPPQEFGTYTLHNGKDVPIFNLPHLLGKKHLSTLRQLTPNGIWERPLVILRRKRRITNVLMKLWQLQGYTADFGWREFEAKQAAKRFEEAGEAKVEKRRDGGGGGGGRGRRNEGHGKGKR